MGRPSTYKPEFCDEAAKLCENGATDIEVAEALDINVATLYRWKGKHPQFCEALKAGKSVADERVERSLYHKAIGYTFDSEKVFQFQGQIVRTETKEHCAPDTTACIFWLKNRRPDRWRDNQQVEHTGKDGGPIEIDDGQAARRIAFALARAQRSKSADKPQE